MFRSVIHSISPAWLLCLMPLTRWPSSTSFWRTDHPLQPNTSASCATPALPTLSLTLRNVSPLSERPSRGAHHRYADMKLQYTWQVSLFTTHVHPPLHVTNNQYVYVCITMYTCTCVVVIDILILPQNPSICHWSPYNQLPQISSCIPLPLYTVLYVTPPPFFRSLRPLQTVSQSCVSIWPQLCTTNSCWV